MRADLERKQATPATHPESGWTAGQGMRVRANRKPRPVVHGARIGSTSRQVRSAQAERDARR